ncbi:hypothetical protein [Streptosporangium sp. KLBMP 9127]|nr:hypothetical protein [Streptosporangium sp. KLBMP 9127]
MTKSRRAPRHTSPAQSKGMTMVSLVVVAGTVTMAMLALTTGWGAAAVASARGFLDFYSGVFALLGLTGTVILGVVTTERTLLSIDHRILSQRVHRATALAGMGFLVTHVALKIDSGLVGAAGAIIPFAGGAGLFVGLGAIAGDIMLLVLLTGLLRGKFAQSARPWMWRALHDSAYLAWPVSILHGLFSGRPPATWVVWSYVLALVGVGVALSFRLAATSKARETAVTPKVEVTEKAAAEPLARVYNLRSNTETRRTG